MGIGLGLWHGIAWGWDGCAWRKEHLMDGIIRELSFHQVWHGMGMGWEWDGMGLETDGQMAWMGLPPPLPLSLSCPPHTGGG